MFIPKVVINHPQIILCIAVCITVFSYVLKIGTIILVGLQYDSWEYNKPIKAFKNVIRIRDSRMEKRKGNKGWVIKQSVYNS